MNIEYNIKFIKHIIKKIIGIHDPAWLLFVFESKINKNTWLNREKALKEVVKQLKDKNDYEKEELYSSSNDPIVRQGYELKKKIEKKFKDILLGKNNTRILIHVPNQESSPGGFSLFTNLAESLEFIGISTKILGWSDSTKQALDEFKPNVFITGDYNVHLEKIDWNAIAKYRENNKLSIGLTAYPENKKPPLTERLDWAKKHSVDFYYVFRDSDYVQTQEEYKPFFDKGYKILFIPFGANILHYYPVPNIEKSLNYVFIASTNKTKAKRYIKYMLPIVLKYLGLIDGPGWRKIKNFSFNKDRDRYIYARSKVGLNIHLEEQINTACEVNERTYQLAACGVPQIIDNAKILPKLFSEKALFIAKNPKEYRGHFQAIMNDPNIGVERALIAQREVFEKHTTFHRAQNFIEQLKYFVNKN